MVDNIIKCLVFCIFQGWIVFFDMLFGQGLFYVVFILEVMVYILLCLLLDDVLEDELCGVVLGWVLLVFEQWYFLLMVVLISILLLEVGDFVWWYCDVIYFVVFVENQQGWGNVMYIFVVLMCEKNLVYVCKVKVVLEIGVLLDDFLCEDYEIIWGGCFMLCDLNIYGKWVLGMDV